MLKEKNKMLSYYFKYEEDLLIFYLGGNIINKDNVIEIEDTIFKNSNNGKKNIVFNLQNMDYINSEGLNFMVKIFSILRNNGFELVLECISDSLNNLLIITKLNMVFNITNNRNETINYFKK